MVYNNSHNKSWLLQRGLDMSSHFFANRATNQTNQDPTLYHTLIPTKNTGPKKYLDKYVCMYVYIYGGFLKRGTPNSSIFLGFSTKKPSSYWLVLPFIETPMYVPSFSFVGYLQMTSTLPSQYPCIGGLLPGFPALLVGLAARLF